MIHVPGYPHLERKLTVWWGTKECREYLRDILIGDKYGDLKFEFETVLTLQELTYQHDIDFPQFAPPATVWDHI